jgi:hypothetical protein
MSTLFAQLWKEYTLSDSRYLTHDIFTVSVETITCVSYPVVSCPLVSSPSYTAYTVRMGSPLSAHSLRYSQRLAQPPRSADHCVHGACVRCSPLLLDQLERVESAWRGVQSPRDAVLLGLLRGVQPTLGHCALFAVA